MRSKRQSKKQNLVAVIGCNSFTGGYVVDELLKSGRWQVLGIDREEKSELFLPYLTQLANTGTGNFQKSLIRQSGGETTSRVRVRVPSRVGFEFARFDLNEDMESLLELLAAHRPEYIINLAALSEVAPSWDHPEEWMQTNVVALTRLVSGLRRAAWLKKYVHISSPEVYGTCEGTVTEEARLNPSTPYAASKAAGDLSLFAFYKNFGLPLVVMRATNVYGAHQQLFKIIPRSVIYIRQDKKIPLHGGGAAIKSYIHARDVARGYIAALQKGRPGEIYHLSPERGVAVREVVRTICELTGKDFESAVAIAEERLGQDKAYVIDSTKARAEFGWEPEITLQEGLQEVVDWIDRSWDEIKKQPLEYVHRA